MAYTQDGDRIGGKAKLDYSAEGAGQYRGVREIVAEPGVYELCTANDPAFAGIMQDNPAAGRTLTVKTMSSSKAVAGAAFANRANLTTDANGRFVLATVGQRVLARALAPAAALGDIVPVRIRPGLELAP